MALLIVEATLALVLTNSKLTEEHVWAGFLCMTGVFAVVLLTAVLFFWFRPKNLLFGKEEHANPALEPSALRDQIEDLIIDNVKPEALRDREPPKL
ncbi:MAG: hypothetical protein JO295_07840 [Verrucomicrobia bacterium]|nr:hypothetical protein [Verrucomicrobiota bacterium]